MENGHRRGTGKPPVLVLAFALALGSSTAPAAGLAAGADPQREPLNSERIARRFGSYGVEILESDARLRVSSLYSVEQGRRICRTLAVVVFPAVLDPAVAAEHRRILDGESIGTVFAELGWAITKRQRLLGEVPGPAPADRLTRLMGVSDSGRLALDVYSFVVSRRGRSVDYATIAEVYHPDYLRLADLRALYGGDVPSSAAGQPELLAILDLVATAVRGPFSEDFEGYEAGQVPGPAWAVETSPGATVAIDTSHARSGRKSVRMHTPAGTGTKTAFIRLAGAGGRPGTASSFFGRMMFRLESAPDATDPAVHWTFIQAGGVVAGQTYRALYRYGGQHPVTDGSSFIGNQLMANYETPDWYGGTGPGSDCWKHADRVVVPVGRWTCVEWQIDGPADSMRLWLDGAPVESLTVSGTGQGCVNQPSSYRWTAPVFDHVDLGWQSYQPDAARTIWIDDVAIARTRIGCP